MESKSKWHGQHWIRDEKRLAIYLRDGLACAYCGDTVEHGAQLSLDHIVPRSKGGNNLPANLVTCCARCNSARGNRPLSKFAVAVADYTGVDSAEIVKRVRRFRNRKLDTAAAKAIMEKR